LGQDRRNQQTNVRVVRPEFRFDSDGGFEAFLGKAEGRVVAALAAYDVMTLPFDTNLYAKPSQGAAQQAWVTLTESNWTIILDTVTANFQR
ncbi:hypothetical protein PHYSODRAFT_405305, partial [Phytophthora sojae]